MSIRLGRPRVRYSQTWYLCVHILSTGGGSAASHGSTAPRSTCPKAKTDKLLGDAQFAEAK